MREILTQRGFSEAEISQAEQLEDYEAVKLRIERIQIDTNLDALELHSDETVNAESLDLAQKWESLKTELDRIAPIQAANTWAETPAWADAPELPTAESIRAGIIAEAEAVGSDVNIPIVGEFNIKWAIVWWLLGAAIDNQTEQASATGFWKLTGGLWWKIITGLLTAFGGWALLAKYNTDISGLSDATDWAIDAVQAVISTWSEIVDEAINEADIPATVSEIIPEDPDALRSIMFKSGFNTLFYFGGVEVDRNNSEIKNYILSQIRTLSLDELNALKSDEEKRNILLWEHKEDSSYINMLEQIIDGFGSQKTQEILSLSLTGRLVSNILTPGGHNKTDLIEVFWENRFNELKRLAWETAFHYTMMTVEEINILYSQTIPYGAFSMIDQAGWLRDDLIGAIWESREEFENNLISPNILAALGSGENGVSIDAGGRNSLKPENDADIISRVWAGLETKEQEQLRSLIDFKNQVLSPTFLENPKLWLSAEYLSAFDANLNYNWIIALYETTHGNANIDELNPMNFPLLILMISQIISRGWINNGENTRLASQYRTRYFIDSLSEGLSWSLSQWEKLAFQYYIPAFTWTAVNVFLQQAYGIQWTVDEAFTSITWLPAENLSEYGIGTSMAMIWGWNRVANAALARQSSSRLGLGLLLKRAWWIGLGYSALDYWLDYYSESGNDAAWTPEEDSTTTPIPDPLWLARIERELRETPIETTARLNESTFTFEIDGESLNVVTYPNPHVVYKWRIWWFTIIDHNQVSEDIEWAAVNFLKSIESMIAGEDEEITDDSVWAINNQVFFWRPDASFTLDVEDTFRSANSDSLTIREIRTLGASIESEFEWSNFWWSTLEYISLQSVGNNKYISLIPIATLSS